MAALAAVVVLTLGAGACGNKESPSATREGDSRIVIIPIEGMACSVCAARVKKALTSVDGVAEVEVDLAGRNARVRFAPSKLSPDRLVPAVTALGYRANAPTEAR